MNEPIGDPRPDNGGRCNIIAALIIGSLALVVPTSADAGAIRNHTLHAKSSHVVSASSADPWGSYWQNALKHHSLHVSGPKALSILALAPDGSLPMSPFAAYLLWRRGLSTERFDSFHPEIAKILRKIKITQIPPIVNPPTTPSQPGQVIPPGTVVPIQPPDFTPLTPTQELIPPQVPEPASGLMAVMMVGGAVAARRWVKRNG
ncbi:MAG: hypothetical protein JWN86_4003 [Planctomycetota bacterium]|nr:hypothetical protein [Planctomycetota bacterium]